MHAVKAVSKNKCKRMNGWSISLFTLAILSHWIDGEPAEVTKVRRQAAEDVARMFARTASACQRCFCGCALPLCRVSHLLHFLNQTPMCTKRKEKRKSTHQWPSVPEHHSVHTMRTQDESIQKQTRYMFGTHKNVPARANPVCAVHRPCLPKDRKRAGMSRSGTSRATQHRWSSLAASGAASWVAKKLQALSNSSVAVLVERRNSHHLPERIMSIQFFRRQSSQRAAPRVLGTRLRAGIWEECLHSIK